MNIPDNLKYINYTLILTDDCNLRCTYCFDNLYSDRSCNKSFNMSIDIIPDFFYFVEKTRDKEKEITFNMFGGEPLMNWEFFMEFVLLAERFCKYNYKIITTTNGTMLTTDKINFLAKHNIKISVSLDGIKEANKARIFSNGNDTWDSVMKSLPELKSKISTTNILVTIGKFNYKYIYDSYKFLISLGFTVVFNYNEYDDYTEEELESIEEQLNRLFVKERLKLTPSMIRREENCKGNICSPANNSVAISIKGDLYFCHQFVPKMTEEKNLTYGNIYEGITNEELYNTFVKRSYFFSWDKDNNIACNNCSIKASCKGGCIAEHWHKTNSFIEVNPNICKISEVLNRVLQRRR